MEIDLKTLASLLGTEVVGRPRPRKRIAICTDSRSIGDGQVFWALKGKNFDGHDFADKVFEKGGYAAVVDRNWLERISEVGDTKKPKERMVNVYVPVADTNSAFLSLAKSYAARFHIPKIGVTGSNGKTTTKDMIVSVLSRSGKVLGTQGNYNNQVGVPLTLFELKSAHDYAVIEMGMNIPGEIGLLSTTVGPSIAVVTNVGYAHLENFGSKEKIMEEKVSITDGFNSKGTLVLNVDDPLLAKVKANTRFKLLTFGIDRGQVRPSGLTFDDDGCASFHIGRTFYRLEVPGRHNVYNALAAIAVGMRLRVPKHEIAKALKSFTSSQNRMQVKRLGNVTVLDDCYNANPSSMKSALATLGAMGKAPRRIAVLGDMLELGEKGAELHREMGNYLVEMGVDELFTFGSLSRFITEGAREKGMPRGKSRHFLDFDLMCNDLLENLCPGDIVLVKASRSMKLERVFEFLKEKSKARPIQAGN